MLVHPAHRRRGLARALLEAVVEDLGRCGVTRLEAYPRHEEELDDPLDIWNGPRALLDELGFTQHLPGNERRAIWSLSLA